VTDVPSTELLHGAVAIPRTATRTSRRAIADRFLAFFSLVLGGYALGSKGFAYFGVSPIYIGEISLFFGLFALSHTHALRRLLHAPLIRVLLAFMAFGAIYRYEAERSPLPTVRQVLPGATVGAVLWVLLCAVYSAYVQIFTNYSATYGALTGVIVLEFWLYISALIVIYCAELNAELERGVFAADQQELGLPEPAQHANHHKNSGPA